MTERPPAGPLVLIAAGVAFVGTLPVMLPYALIAAVLSAIAAWALGLPVLRLVIRFGFRGALPAVWSGALTAALAPAAGLLLLVPLTMAKGGGPTGIGQLARSLVDATAGAGPIAAVFGAATAIIYWSRYVASGRDTRQTPLIALISVGITTGMFTANYQVGRRISRDRAAQYAAEYKAQVIRQASPDRAVSVRLVRLFDRDADAVRLASPQEPGCAIVINSRDLAGRVSIGASVWVDLAELDGTVGGFRVSRVGEFDSAELLANARVDRCRPWH